MQPTTSTPLIPPRLIRQLEALDWDFPDYLPGSSKAVHWYPGTFPSELPSTLIQALSKPGDLIFDPYGGIGTTAMEALRQQRKAWLVECNPVAVLVSYVSGGLILLKAIDKALPFILIDLVREIVDRCDPERGGYGRLVTDNHLVTVIDERLSRTIRPKPSQFAEEYQAEPLWNGLQCWIEEKTLNDVARLFNAIVNAPLGQFGRLLGLMMISAILRPISSQTKSWGHIADNVRPKEFEQKNVFQLCNRWLSRTKTLLEKTDVVQLGKEDLAAPRYWVSKHDWNQKNQPKSSPQQIANVMITSPPYAGAIDYIFAQRLSLYLLGYTIDSIGKLSATEIGARRKRSMASSREKWAEDLVKAMDKQSSFLHEKSYLSLVLPHKDAGRDIGPARVESFLLSNSWEKMFEVDRSIRQLRTRQSWTSIKKETIQIYGH